MNTWQPIATAPQDGTEVIVGFDMATVWITRGAFYQSTDMYNEPLPDSERGWWSYQSCVTQEKLEGLYKPTHWLPMPEPPGGE